MRLLLVATISITKTCLFKYTDNFTTKKWKISDKKSDIFHISAQNIDCGYSLEPPRRGGSNEYPQSMCWAKIRKNNVYPCKPQFNYVKVGFKGSKLYRHVFVMVISTQQSHYADFTVSLQLDMTISPYYLGHFWWIIKYSIVPGCKKKC